MSIEANLDFISFGFLVSCLMHIQSLMTGDSL